MKKIEKLLEVSEYLGLQKVSKEIESLKNRKESENQILVLPIVGEFSSGKTTLINALTNSKKLETASKATTAVIYEIFFGNEKESGQIIYRNGEVKTIDDLSSIKNDSLDDVEFIRVFDTSDKIANTTVIVDTPGLSSNDPRHLEALNGYLPNADAILLCTDINQQITNSLIEFIKTAKLTERPIFLMVTKTDTKTQSEVTQAIGYIQQNIDLPLENIICVSSKNDNLEEFYNLIDTIQKNKNQIVNKKIDFQLEQIRQSLLVELDDIIKSTSSPNEMEKERKNKQKELERLLHNIQKLSYDVTNEIEKLNRETSQSFENAVSSRLESIIVKRDANIDSQAYNAIKSSADIILNKYKGKVKETLILLAQSRRGTDDSIDLQSIQNTDLSFVEMGDIDYTMNLYGAGQENNKLVGGIVKGVLVAAAVGGVIVTGGLGTIAAAFTGKKTIDMVDTATDVASVASNMKTQRQLKAITQEKINEGIAKVNSYSQTAENINNAGGGFVTKAVSWGMEALQGKPQRQKAIRNYLQDTLMPQFKGKMSEISSSVISNIIASLNNEASEKIEGINRNIEELQRLEKEQKVEFANRINTLKIFKQNLS